MDDAPRKLMILAFIAILLLPLVSSEEATDLEKYLDCLTDKKVDIVFVFDTTNSMGGEINELCAIAQNFATDLNASHIDHRLGLLEFRDFPKTCSDDGTSCGSPGDFPYRVKGDGNLTEDTNTFNSWLKELKAGGGGSGGPEAVLAALRHAGSDCRWRDDAEKVIIVVTDVGPHPDGDCCNAEGDTLNGTIFGLTGEGAKVYVIGPNDAALKKIAGETGGQLFKIRSGLSLKPLLKEITGAMSCSFKVEAETTCQNKTLVAKVRLVGKEVIPYVAGQTEAWMYINQAGNSSRYNLSYDQAADAYLVSVPDTCGSVELTVYGHVGERSAVQTTKVDCGSCTAATALETSNQPPEMIGLTADPTSPQETGAVIIWTAVAKSPDSDPLLYRFFLNDEPITNWTVTNWTAENSWTWKPLKAGSYRIEAQVRDETNGLDDRRSDSFEIDQHAPPAPIVTTPLVPTIPAIDAHVESWNKVFGGSNWDEGISGVQTSDGGYIIIGLLQSTEIGKAGIWLIKTDAKGNKLWDKTFGKYPNEEGNSVQQTNDGGYIIIGKTSDIGVLLLIKTDTDGNEIWDRTFDTFDGIGHSVQQTTDGGYIITGYASSIGAGNTDVWLIKTDASGNKLWDKTFGGSNDDSASSVQQTNDGGYVVAGATSSIGAGNTDVWLIKTDASGNKLWDKTFGGSGEETGASVQQTTDGGYIITGTTDSFGAGGGLFGGDAWLIKTDSQGNDIWNRTFGGSNSESSNSVQQTNDGGYIIVGTTFSFGTRSNGDKFGLKFDSNGEVIKDTNGMFSVMGSPSDVWLIKTDADGHAPSSPEGD